MISDADAPKKLHKNEYIKTDSNYLRGTILEGLSDSLTGQVADDDTQLLKFHGIYQQDDRDLRNERRKQRLEKLFSFMIRVRVPGGVSTSEQYLAMDHLCDTYCNGTLKLTTRQAYQVHGVLKHNLKTTMQGINKAAMDTIAACGDVNRNVMCNPNPHQSELHADALKVASDISAHLTPQTGAYHEIWLDGEKVESSEEEVEPIYGKTYLPRKFKIAMAIPPSNDVDVFAHCLGYIAIVEDGRLVGFNVTVGGGMGTTHGKKATYPRLADVMGFCTVDQAVAVAEAVVKVQRDHGQRADRTHARFKYTVDDHGVDWIRDKVEGYLDFKMQPARDYSFDSMGDRYGWVEGPDGKQNLTLFIENGRVNDFGDLKIKTALREVAKIHTGDFRLTANQNMIIANIDPAMRGQIEAILSENGLDDTYVKSGIRLNSMACVALPTCGLALAESQRYLPELVTRLESELEQVGLKDEPIVIRMTGCPNGCARPFMAEIGLVGKAPNRYNLYLGAAFDGSRMSKLVKESASEDEIVEVVKPLFGRFAAEKESEEHFGDFLIRAGVVAPVKVARTDFHD
ncbi:MAG: NADPH-dependent assimilatory sulfite reductase hemoprotein subunit [Opitutales bacterium]|nr:NADPH-dependent assimilatory sulfite reductase hemoprotein subunit [Opitutales bacterium]NRA27970.1 NADPH-dependent assimilatory sulfite reductase hemoprotein subunit [Opitutales bacterium]